MIMGEKIKIKRLKVKEKSLKEQADEIFEEWVAYWRANPHRFITEYLGLVLYDFQKVLLYDMDKSGYFFIFVGSRGIAKSTITLLFAIERAILYPGVKILVVCPVKSQSRNFVKKVYEFINRSPNLRKEIDVSNIKTGINESEIPFYNNSKIFTTVYGEGSLGLRTNVLIIDEFVRTDKEVVSRVFDPMLSDTRSPIYKNLSSKERLKCYEEEGLKKILLSSIRRADEWSYEELENYIDEMTNGNKDYGALIVPYQLGVKNGFISRKTVENSFKNNEENRQLLLAEYSAIPERGIGNSYFTYSMFQKVRNNSRALYCMSDEEYIEYKDKKDKWLFYQEKLPNEIRILTVDIALLESSKNDNTAIYVIRLVPDGGKFKKIISFGESMHGINSIVQTKRIKQLFYELECDYAVIDTQGAGMSVFDFATTETYDDGRDIIYPAWTVVNPEDVKMVNRTISSNAVPLIYSVKTSIQVKSAMFGNMRDMITSREVSLLSDTQEAIDYLNKNYEYYKIENDELRARLLNPYVQTDMLINESINLEQIVTQGYINLKEKSGRRKDRTMSIAYGLWYAKILEDELLNQSNSSSILDYIIAM